MKARRKIVLFSPELLKDWMIEGSEMPKNALRCVIGIPNDAVFIRGYYDSRWNAFAAIYEHPTWEEVKDDGRDLPIIEVQISSFFGVEHFAEI